MYSKCNNIILWLCQNTTIFTKKISCGRGINIFVFIWSIITSGLICSINKTLQSVKKTYITSFKQTVHNFNTQHDNKYRVLTQNYIQWSVAIAIPSKMCTFQRWQTWQILLTSRDAFNISPVLTLNSLQILKNRECVLKDEKTSSIIRNGYNTAESLYCTRRLSITNNKITVYITMVNPRKTCCIYPIQFQ